MQAKKHRPGLDRNMVVNAAAHLLNQEGTEALTINRLARELGVQPPSLYNHVQGLPDLRRALAVLNAQLLAERLAKAAIGRSGAEGVRALAHSYRAYIKESPGLYQSSLLASGNMPEHDPKQETAERRAVDVVLAVIAPFGLQGEAAVHAVRGLRSMVHGFATLEINGGFGMPLDLEESFDRLVAAFIVGLEQAGGNTHRI